MKRIFLFVALSLFYTSAMVVVGGYNVSSDAAQLWNSNRDNNDQSSGSPYFNQQTPSHKRGHQLFNGDGATINRKDARNQSIEYKKLQRKNLQRVSNRIPAIFEYMSPYAVENRLNDTEYALARQAERVRNTEKLLKKKNADYKKYDFQKFYKKNREKLYASMPSSRRYMNKRKKVSQKNNNRDSDQSGKSSSYTTSLSPSRNIFNSTRSSDDKSGKKATLFNSLD